MSKNFNQAHGHLDFYWNDFGTWYCPVCRTFGDEHQVPEDYPCIGSQDDYYSI